MIPRPHTPSRFCECLCPGFYLYRRAGDDQGDDFGQSEWFRYACFTIVDCTWNWWVASRSSTETSFGWYCQSDKCLSVAVLPFNISGMFDWTVSLSIHLIAFVTAWVYVIVCELDVSVWVGNIMLAWLFAVVINMNELWRLCKRSQVLGVGLDISRL